jgi:sortase A
MATSHRARLTRPAPADDLGPLPPHAMAPRRHRAWLWLERALFLGGIVSLSYFAYVNVEAALYQAYERRELDAILRSGPAAADAPHRPPAVAQRPPAPGTPLGRIDIARLGVSAVVRAGADARTLNLAVGHIPGTALPGDPGNVGLAGHRDTFFRRLRDIRGDEEIRIVTPEGTYVYTVERTLVVDPGDVWVLDSDGEAVLTLVTCYPFTYIGSAPQRFIVRARLNSEPRHPEGPTMVELKK